MWEWRLSPQASPASNIQRCNSLIQYLCPNQACVSHYVHLPLFTNHYMPSVYCRRNQIHTSNGRADQLCLLIGKWIPQGDQDWWKALFYIMLALSARFMPPFVCVNSKGYQVAMKIVVICEEMKSFWPWLMCITWRVFAMPSLAKTIPRIPPQALLLTSDWFHQLDTPLYLK